MKFLIIAPMFILGGCEDSLTINESLRREVYDLREENQLLRSKLAGKRMDGLLQYENLQLEKLKGDKIKASKVYKDGCLAFKDFLSRKEVKLESKEWDYCENMKLYDGFLYFNGKEYAYKL